MWSHEIFVLAGAFAVALMALDIASPTPGSALVSGTGNGIAIEVAVDGVDADEAPGPRPLEQSTIRWTYSIEVTADENLYDVLVTDSNGSTPNCDIDGDGQPDGFNIHPGPLKAGDRFLCRASTRAKTAGSTYASSGFASATNVAGDQNFSASDPTHYTPRSNGQGATTSPPPSTTATSTSRPITTRRPTTEAPATAAPQPEVHREIELALRLNAAVADTAPGLVIPPGSTATWSATISNVGDTALRDIWLSNDAGLSFSCDGRAAAVPALSAGTSVTCTATSTAGLVADGVGSMTANVVGTPAHPTSSVELAPVTATGSVYFSSVPIPGRLAFTGSFSVVAACVALASILLGSWLVQLQVRWQRCKVPSNIKN